MKKTKYIPFAVLFSVILSIFSCSGYSQLEDNEMFSFVIEPTLDEISVGERVTFVVKLTNLTNETIAFRHALPLISFGIISIDDETPWAKGTISIPETFPPNGYFERTLNIEPMEAGEFIVRAIASFRVGSREFGFEINHPLTVVE